MKKLFTTCLLSALIVAPTFAQSKTTDEFKNHNREYYLIQLDEDVNVEHLKANPNNVIKADLRVDDATKFLYIWDNTYAAETTSGKNFYDTFTGYINLKVQNAGWSGGGFALQKSMNPNYYVDLTGLTADYKMHIALKSTAKNSHLFFLWGASNLSGKVCIGASAFVDNGVSYQPYTDFARDGQWHLIEIPLSKFIESGFRSPEPFNDGNYFSFLSGNASGSVIGMDAIFIYKELNGSGINDEKADNARLDVIVTKNVVTFVGASQDKAIQLYDISGKLVKTLSEPIIGVSELTQGVYIAKSGTASAKFVIK